MKRFAIYHRVYFVEEFRYYEGMDKLEISKSNDEVWILVPCLETHLSSKISVADRITRLLDGFIKKMGIYRPLLWYYTPLALQYSPACQPSLIVYDCMDEQSALRYAPSDLKILEAELFKRADLVFVGGRSLFELKKPFHKSIHLFPSSIDRIHFERARAPLPDPDCQKSIPFPRLGFFGVIDDRFDADLVRRMANLKPEWQFVFIGPVTEGIHETLPKATNLHYLGIKPYALLPKFISNWDIAIIPFAKNPTTKYISPTKTPEYLAAGKPVISTSIPDVVDPFGKTALVTIADTPDDFIGAATHYMKYPLSESRLEKIDRFLNSNSWDETWEGMCKLIDFTLKSRAYRNSHHPQVYV
jgi:UDP-galactopyranose mutase